MFSSSPGIQPISWPWWLQATLSWSKLTSATYTGKRNLYLSKEETDFCLAMEPVVQTPSGMEDIPEDGILKNNRDGTKYLVAI